MKKKKLKISSERCLNTILRKVSYCWNNILRNIRCYDAFLKLNIFKIPVKTWAAQIHKKPFYNFVFLVASQKHPHSTGFLRDVHFIRTNLIIPFLVLHKHHWLNLNPLSLRLFTRSYSLHASVSLSSTHTHTRSVIHRYTDMFMLGLCGVHGEKERQTPRVCGCVWVDLEVGINEKCRNQCT